jgi:hypothetical protein
LKYKKISETKPANQIAASSETWEHQPNATAPFRIAILLFKFLSFCADCASAHHSSSSFNTVYATSDGPLSGNLGWSRFDHCSVFSAASVRFSSFDKPALPNFCIYESMFVNHLQGMRRESSS